MNILDTLAVRFEADAGELFASLDAIDARLLALRSSGEQPVTLPLEWQAQLTVTADEAISHALSSAGDTIAEAIRAHDVAFSDALADAQRAMAGALQSAADKLASSITITVPVNIDGQRLADATISNLRRRSLSQGMQISI